MANYIEWNDENRTGFTHKDQVFKHNFHESPMFSDEGLIKLIDNYPKENLEVFTMGYNPIGWGEWFLGRRGNLSGAQLMEAVKAGRIWLNLRKCNLANPELDAAAQEIFAEIKRETGVNSFKHDMGLLISSPNAHVYYHADGPLVMLWQIRGIKKVFLYPAKEPCLNDKQLEAIMLRENDEQLKFDPSYEKYAFVHDLKPGEFLSWHQNAPHRIENHDCVNVSFSVEFLTTEAVWRANLAYANGVLRRMFGLNPSLEKSPKLLEPLKIIFARFVKLMGGYKKVDNLPRPKFSLDESNLGNLIFDQGIKAPQK